MLAKNIILNTKASVSALDAFIRTLPFSFDLTTEGCVFGIFSYLADEENAHEYTLEYLHDLKEEMNTSTRDPELIEKLGEYLYEVARAMWEEMVVWKIYTHSGICWYYPRELLNFDLVLFLSDDEDSIKEDLADASTNDDDE